MPDDNIPLDFPLADTPYGRIWNAAHQRIKSHGLVGIPAERIVQRKVVWWRGENDPLQPPFVIVARRDESTPWNEGTNERDAVSYGVLVFVALAMGLDESMKGAGLQEKWRMDLRRLFHNKCARDITELSFANLTNMSFNRSYVESGSSYNELAKQLQLDSQTWLIRFNCWEPRT